MNRTFDPRSRVDDPPRMELTAEQLTLLGSTALISLLHSLLPSHWLCFSLVGRVQRWSMRRTVSIAAIAGGCHILATLALTLATRRAVSGLSLHEYEHIVPVLLLSGLGAFYLIQQFMGRGHQHGRDEGRLSTLGLILLPTLSPCTAAIPFLLGAASSSTKLLILAAGILAASTLAIMLPLVALSTLGIEKLKLEILDRHEKTLIGILLIGLALLLLLFHPEGA